MKKLIVLSFTFSIFSHAESLRSQQAKEAICSSLESSYSQYGVTKNLCLEGQFNVSEKKATKLGDRDKVTVMVVDVSFSDKKFKVRIKRGIYLNNEGEVYLKPNTWALVNVMELNQGAASVIMNSHTNSPNVKEITEEEELNQMPDEVGLYWHYSEAPDYDLDSFRYYKILNPLNLEEIVGYIVEESTHSYESAQRYLVTQKFDADGNKVEDPYEESWGFNE